MIHGSPQVLIDRPAFIAGTLIAASLAAVWILAGSGLSLITTFLPGIFFAWLLFAGL